MFRKSRVFFLLIIIFLVVILSLPLQISQSIKIKIVNFVSPLLSLSNRIVQKAVSVSRIFYAVKENKELRRKVELFSSQLNEYIEVKNENQRLMQLLDFKKLLGYKTTACRVIARDPSSWYKTLVIDKGTNSGINIDMPVICNSGIIGRIIDCDADVSRVLLITDINSSIGGIIQDSRAVGIVEGDGSGSCVFNLISKKEDIKTGSIIVTSGLSEIFPKGLLIGKVKNVFIGNQGLYKTAELELSSDIDKVTEVLVITSASTPIRQYHAK